MAEPTLMLNRERRALLDDVQAGRVSPRPAGSHSNTDGRTYVLTDTAPPLR